MKYGDLNLGQVEALVNKLGGMGEVNRILTGETKFTPSWYEEDDIIYLSVTSDGTDGPRWIKRLRKNGFYLDSDAEKLLSSREFSPTSNNEITKIAILKGSSFKDSGRACKNIKAMATNHSFIIPRPEIACLIRKKFNDEDIKAMGFKRIVVMHQPIKVETRADFSDPGFDHYILNVSRDLHPDLTRSYPKPKLGVSYEGKESMPGWTLEDEGFAFVVS